MEKLEVLQYARVAGLAWTTHDVAAGLGLAEPDLAVAAAGLCQAGLLRRDGYAYQCTPQAQALGAAVDVLYRAHGFDPVQVLRALEALARDPT